ncbi:MAG: DUF2510 domain-containing protein [Actinobacteria bacterium]|nr:DUF2510 domain-containing protein [Actinomycetota bacterium]
MRRTESSTSCSVRTVVNEVAEGTGSLPADWYPDPLDPASIRYWDGAQWTVHTAPLPSPDVNPTPAATLPFAADGGTAVLGDAEAAAPMASAATSPARKRRKGLVAALVGVACLVLLIGVGVVATLMLNGGPRSATATVQSYVDAIAAGDAAKANSLGDPGIPEKYRSLLTDEVLRSADSRIQVRDVKLVGETSTRATVQASFSLSGKSFTHRFMLRKGPNEFLVLNTWRLQDALVFPVEFSPLGPGRLALGSMSIPSATHWMYPGAYTFHAAPSPYFEGGDATLVLTAGSPDSHEIVQPAQSPTGALTDKVLTAVKDRVTACVSVPTNMDDPCPAAARNTDLSALSVAAQPSGLVSLTADRFESEAATIVTQSNTRSGYTPPPKRTSFALSGSISWQSGEPEISFDAQ